jgi:hypothetical protein
MTLEDDRSLGKIQWTPGIFSETTPDSGRRRATILAGFVVIALTGLLATAAFRRGADRTNVTEADGGTTPQPDGALAPQKMRQKLRNALPPVTTVPILSARAPEAAILDEDFVVGVAVAGLARAYAINMMGKPEAELLNDTIAGRPIAVTFCGTCQSPLVFDRRVEGKTLTLQLNGELLGENMVMRDVETGSIWVQLTGEAIEGPLEGNRLEQIPAVWTDWRTWREEHPETTLLDLPNLVHNYRHHVLYSSFAQERSFFARLQWGLARGGKARSWPYAQLARQPLVNDAFSGQPLLIVFNRQTSTPRAFNRRHSNALLTFHWQGNRVTDQETGSTWNPFTGIAVSGSLQGQSLEPVAGTISLEAAWQRFHPESEIWSAER